jgi:hypothetical protein
MQPPNMTLEELENFILERLPRVLEQDPRFVTFIEGIVSERFPRRDEFALLLQEVRTHRQETAERFDEVGQQFATVDQRFEQVDQRFEQVDQRFEQVDQRFAEMKQSMEDGFHAMHVAIDRLGQRWGIRNEAIFRQTMREILEKSFGVRVVERRIGGEQYDVVIIGDAHILVEISASVGKDILKKLQRKRQVYIDATGVIPARFLLAVGDIHSSRANALRAAGFEVVEPVLDEDGNETLE